MKKTITYGIKIKQDLVEVAEDLVGGVVETVVNNLPFTSLKNNHLVTNNSSRDTQRIYLNKDICGEYADNSSNPSVNVPTSEGYRYILKKNFEYTYLTDNPLPFAEIDPHFILSLNNKPYSDLSLGDLIYRDHVATLLPRQTDLNENGVYSAYSLNHGGLSKSDCYFFYVDLLKNIRLFNQEDYFVDYLEGYIYVRKEESISMELVGCFYNIEPVKIIPKGDYTLTENTTGFYELVNISEKHLISIDYINDEEAVLTSLENMIISNNADLTFDGVFADQDQFIYLKKNEPLLISIAPSLIEQENVEYLESNLKVFTSLAEIDNKLLTTQIQKSKSATADEFTLTLYRETGKNTYNKSYPLTLTIF